MIGFTMMVVAVDSELVGGVHAQHGNGGDVSQIVNWMPCLACVSDV